MLFELSCTSIVEKAWTRGFCANYFISLNVISLTCKTSSNADLPATGKIKWNGVWDVVCAEWGHVASSLSLVVRGRLACGGPSFGLQRPSQNVVTHSSLLVGYTAEELRSDREKVSCAVRELREYYLIVGLMENIMWGWFRSFQRSASNLRSGALLKTAGEEAGALPSPCLFMP